MSGIVDPKTMSDADLAAHLAEVAGRILVEVRSSGLFSPKALGKAGDQTANQFLCHACLLYTSPSPRDRQKSRMPSSA